VVGSRVEFRRGSPVAQNFVRWVGAGGRPLRQTARRTRAKPCCTRRHPWGPSEEGVGLRARTSVDDWRGEADGIPVLIRRGVLRSRLVLCASECLPE
jgi:hypothetical protein